MLRTKIINDDVCAVSFEPNEILVRNRGKSEFGKEKSLVKLDKDGLHIDVEVAREFNIDVKMYNFKKLSWSMKR